MNAYIDRIPVWVLLLANVVIVTLALNDGIPWYYMAALYATFPFVLFGLRFCRRADERVVQR